MFLARRRRTICHLCQPVRRRCEEGGMPSRCLDLRYCFTSTFMQVTCDITALQAFLGHKTISMTMRYAHMIADHLHRMVGNIGTKTGTATADFPVAADA